MYPVVLHRLFTSGW